MVHYLVDTVKVDIMTGDRHHKRGFEFAQLRGHEAIADWLLVRMPTVIEYKFKFKATIWTGEDCQKVIQSPKKLRKPLAKVFGVADKRNITGMKAKGIGNGFELEFVVLTVTELHPKAFVKRVIGMIQNGTLQEAIRKGAGFMIPPFIHQWKSHHKRIGCDTVGVQAVRSWVVMKSFTV